MVGIACSVTPAGVESHRKSFAVIHKRFLEILFESSPRCPNSRVLIRYRTAKFFIKLFGDVTDRTEATK